MSEKIQKKLTDNSETKGIPTDPFGRVLTPPSKAAKPAPDENGGYIDIRTALTAPLDYAFADGSQAVPITIRISVGDAKAIGIYESAKNGVSVEEIMPWLSTNMTVHPAPLSKPKERINDITLGLLFKATLRAFVEANHRMPSRKELLAAMQDGREVLQEAKETL